MEDPSSTNKNCPAATKLKIIPFNQVDEAVKKTADKQDKLKISE